MHFWVHPARLSSRGLVEDAAHSVSFLDATLFMRLVLVERDKGLVRRGALPRLSRGRRGRAVRPCFTQPFRK